MGKDMECPLIDEIKALKDFGDSVILIDDARAFLGPLPPPHDNSQWPKIDEIFLLLKKLFPSNLITIADDVIYCIPPHLIDLFNENWIRNYAVRFGETKCNLLKRFRNSVMNSLKMNSLKK